jgi:hypothetical protein
MVLLCDFGKKISVCEFGGIGFGMIVCFWSQMLMASTWDNYYYYYGRRADLWD